MPEEERGAGEAFLVESCTRSLPSVGDVAGGSERGVAADDTAGEAPLGVYDLGGAPSLKRLMLLTSLQFFFCNHGKLEQLVGGIKNFIVNDIRISHFKPL